MHPPLHDEDDSEVYAAISRLGAGTLSDLEDELSDIDLGRIESSVSRLVRSGKVLNLDDMGLYKLSRSTISLAGLEDIPSLVCNDPTEMLSLTRVACDRYQDVPRLPLDGVFSQLVRSARERLQIVSPFMDRVSVMRFLPEFIESFSRGIEFTLVTRGIFQREDGSRRYQYVSKLEALQILWNQYWNLNPDGRTKFVIRDYLKWRPRDPSQGGLPFPSTVGEDDLPGSRLISAAVHHKIIVQDRKWVYLGSGEFRSNSFGPTGEVGVLLHGRYAEMVSDIIQCYASRGLPVEPSSLEELKALSGTQD